MQFSYDPTIGDKSTRRKIAGDIYEYLIGLTERAELIKKPFEVSFNEKKRGKSWLQVKGIHLLCAKLIPHLSKEHNMVYCLEQVKDFVKREFNYMRKPTPFEIAIMLKSVGIDLNESDKNEAKAFCKTVRQPKSFRDATKEEMMELITSIEAWAAEKGWKDVYLEQEEIKKMINYYEATTRV